MTISTGKTQAEKDQYEFNLRNQITLWGPEANIRDYAGKQWSGIMSSYYYNRWLSFYDEMVSSDRDKRPFDNKRFLKDVNERIDPDFVYNLNNITYPVKPIHDTVEVARSIYKNWGPYFLIEEVVHGSQDRKFLEMENSLTEEQLPYGARFEVINPLHLFVEKVQEVDSVMKPMLTSCAMG